MPLSVDDKLAIHELLSLHGHLADDRRIAELHLLLTEDAAYDVRDYGLGVVTGLPALRALFDAASGAQPLGHHVTNVVVTEADDGTIGVRSKGLAVMPSGPPGR